MDNEGRQESQPGVWPILAAGAAAVAAVGLVGRELGKGDDLDAVREAFAHIREETGRAIKTEIDRIEEFYSDLFPRERQKLIGRASAIHRAKEAQALKELTAHLSPAAREQLFRESLDEYFRPAQ